MMLGGADDNDGYTGSNSTFAIATATSATIDQWSAGDDDTLYVYKGGS